MICNLDIQIHKQGNHSFMRFINNKAFPLNQYHYRNNTCEVNLLDCFEKNQVKPD